MTYHHHITKYIHDALIADLSTIGVSCYVLLKNTKTTITIPGVVIIPTSGSIERVKHLNTDADIDYSLVYPHATADMRSQRVGTIPQTYDIHLIAPDTIVTADTVPVSISGHTWIESVMIPAIVVSLDKACGSNVSYQGYVYAASGLCTQGYSAVMTVTVTSAIYNPYVSTPASITSTEVTIDPYIPPN